MSHQLYQQMILDHSRSPKGFVENPQGCCEDAFNPLCGDKVKLCVTLDRDRIIDIQFWGEGCSLSMASASILIDVVKGLTITEFRALQSDFFKRLKGDKVSLPNKLHIFEGVVQYPMRVKCVTMVWHAAGKAIDMPIQLSLACIEYWKRLIKAQKGIGVLIDFKQLGCFGWQFVPSVQITEPENKLAYQYGDLVLWLDRSLVSKVQGTKVDYIANDLGQSQVVFQHPKAKQHCGCGESFVIEDPNG